MPSFSRITIPSKTFFIGEYLALQGGPSLVAATKPYFQFFPSQAEDVHPESPAGQLRNQTNGHTGLKIEHPHCRKGGFGASTAEFLAVMYQMQVAVGSARELLDKYRACLHGTPGSGADLIAQHYGGLSFWNENLNQQKSYQWPFSTLRFSIFQCQQKVKTHEHLRGLGHIDFSDLKVVAQKAVEAVQSRQTSPFLDALREYREALQRRKLVSEQTQNLVIELEKNPGVRHARGCGALGADVIAVFHEPDFRAREQGWDTKFGLAYTASEQDLVEPMEL